MYLILTASTYTSMVDLPVMYEGLDGGVLNSLFNKNIDINSVFGKYKVNTIKYDIRKYLFDKM